MGTRTIIMGRVGMIMRTRIEAEGRERQRQTLAGLPLFLWA